MESQPEHWPHTAGPSDCLAQAGPAEPLRFHGQALRTVPCGQYAANMAPAWKRQQYVGPLYKVEEHRLHEGSAQFDWLLECRREAGSTARSASTYSTETAAWNAGV